jgi:alpha-L-rhamnosidase
MKWKAHWIMAPEFAGYQQLFLLHKEYEPVASADHPEHLRNHHMLVRKPFELPNKPSQATLRITADDYYKLYVNGCFVGQGPAQGYWFHYHYNEWDISEYLQSGQNVIAVHVYYQGCLNRAYNSADLRQGMIAELHTEQGLVLVTDGSWKFIAAGEYGEALTVGYETQYVENIDQREFTLGWNTLNFMDDDWSFVAIKRDIDYKLVLQSTPPLSVYHCKPRNVHMIREGYYVIDFGMEMTGQFEMCAHGESGQKIVLRYGEELQEDGQSVRFDMRCNCVYSETWTLSGREDKLQQYEYKAFRYVEVIGPHEAIQADSFAAIVRHYPLDEQATQFESSDGMLNRIWSICKRGVQLCAQENFVDCPSREKGQYLGDNTIMGHTHMYISGDMRLFRKAIHDFSLTSSICPGLLAVAPGHFMQEIADFSLQWPMQLLLYYHHSGDEAFLREMYPIAEGVVNYFKKFAREDGLLAQVNEKWNLVDWPDNLRDGYDFSLTRPVGEGCHNVLNAFYYGCIQAVQQIKSILSIPYEDELPALRQSFVHVFFRPETDLFADAEFSNHSSLHANMIPLYFELAPESSIPSIISLIRQKRLSCGVYMAYFLLKALAVHGETELVYELITCKDDRSWSNMVKEGASSCFEAWGKEQKWNTSLCHGWASAPIPLLIEEIIGLKPAKPGWTQIRFEPRIPQSMPDFRLTFPTPAGQVGVVCQKGKLQLIVPDGVTVHGSRF